MFFLPKLFVLNGFCCSFQRISLPQLVIQISLSRKGPDIPHHQRRKVSSPLFLVFCNIFAWLSYFIPWLLFHSLEKLIRFHIIMSRFVPECFSVAIDLFHLCCRFHVWRVCEVQLYIHTQGY